MPLIARHIHVLQLCSCAATLQQEARHSSFHSSCRDACVHCLYEGFTQAEHALEVTNIAQQAWLCTGRACPVTPLHGT
jgi:hypothetical protein